jgi:hypothetical protein
LASLALGTILALVADRACHAADIHDLLDALFGPTSSSFWMFMQEVPATLKLFAVQLAGKFQVGHSFTPHLLVFVG